MSTRSFAISITNTIPSQPQSFTCNFELDTKEETTPTGPNDAKLQKRDSKVTSDYFELAPLQPGKGLLMYSERLSKFFFNLDGSPAKLWRANLAQIIPENRPETHRISFVDDPPYSLAEPRRYSEKLCGLPGKPCEKKPLRKTPNWQRVRPEGETGMKRLRSFVVYRKCLPNWIRQDKI